MDQAAQELIGLAYTAQNQKVFNQKLLALLGHEKVTKIELPKRVEKTLLEGKSYPISSQAALRFLTYLPLSQFRKGDIYDNFLAVLTPQDVKRIPPSTGVWGEQKFLRASITAGVLDFPRKKLPPEIWLYEDDKPLPRLQPALRATILSEARYRLRKFGAKLVGCMIYGGASTYQYHRGADIDCSCYIDWNEFKGDEEIIMEAFKSVEIPWDGYELHLFVKPSDQREQGEVADACYDVMRDEWVMPPLILPRDFDPNIFFQPFLEQAELKAERIDMLMGRIAREWGKLKTAAIALEEGGRDLEAIENRVAMQKLLVKHSVDMLVDEFTRIWKARKTLHDSLRSQYINHPDVNRYVRFQLPEIMWKYLDQSGYAEFLKTLSKAHEAGIIDDLLEQIAPHLEPLVESPLTVNAPEINPIREFSPSTQDMHLLPFDRPEPPSEPGKKEPTSAPSPELT